MQLVTAVVRPHMLDTVKEALTGLGVSGVTVSDVRGFGRQRGHTETYRGAEYTVDFMPKVKVEILVDDANVAAVAEAIASAGRTGKIGDGKLWVTGVSRIVRIRTGEEGPEAL